MIVKTWETILSRPSEKVFAGVLDRHSANLWSALAWVLLAAVIGGLIVFARVKLYDLWTIPESQLEWPPPSQLRVQAQRTWDLYAIERSMRLFEITRLFGELWRDSGLHPIAYEIVNSVLRFLRPSLSAIRWDRMVLGPLYLLLSMSVYHFIAWLLGGRGEFRRFFFLAAMCNAPLKVLTPLLGFIALVGVGIAALTGASHMTGQYWVQDIRFYVNTSAYFLLPSYWLCLMYFATKVAYGLSTRQAIFSVVAARLLISVVKAIAVHGLLLGLYVTTGPT